MESNPELTARLDLDPQGKPRVVRGDGKNHYKVFFEVKNAPSDAYAATFYLDPTYYDPVRTVQRDREGKFVLETTSFGDYPLKVEVRTKEASYEVIDSLSRMLKRSRAEMPQVPEVDSAISDIEEN